VQLTVPYEVLWRQVRQADREDANIKNITQSDARALCRESAVSCCWPALMNAVDSMTTWPN